MTVLLRTDSVVLYEPSDTVDEHGWRLPGGDPAWAGHGNLQLGAGFAAQLADALGGHGPHAPRSVSQGAVFLPAEARPRDGMVLVARGSVYVLSQSRWVTDPSGGDVGCWTATVTALEVTE